MKFLGIVLAKIRVNVHKATHPSTVCNDIRLEATFLSLGSKELVE